MKLSVLIPTYNAEKYLKEALESILNQTFSDFEVLILDDNSADNTVKIAESFGDKRIKIIQNNPSLGLSGCLNQGMKLAEGEYVARMDADDIACPDRFQVQADFLDNHPDISIAGSLARTFPVEKIDYNYFSQGHEKIKIMLLFRCMLIHPSVMMRRADIINNNLFYNAALKSGEDYDLWVRASKKIKIENIDKVLINYRKHPEQISKNYRICPADYDIWRSELSFLGIVPTDKELLIHSMAAGYDFYFCNFYKRDLKKWFDKLVMQNNIMGIYDKELFKETLKEQFKWLTKTKQVSIAEFFKYPYKVYSVFKNWRRMNG